MARYLQKSPLVLRVFKILTALAMLVLSADLGAQNGEGDVFTPIGKYIVKGDADSLSAWFDENLEISILSHSSTASREQARQIIKAFFNSQRPQSFVISHSSERSNMKYALGILEAGGSNYNVTIFVSYSRNAYKIQQFKIESL